MKKVAEIYGDRKALRAHHLGLNSRGPQGEQAGQHKASGVQTEYSSGYTPALHKMHPDARFLSHLIKANGDAAHCL